MGVKIVISSVTFVCLFVFVASSSEVEMSESGYIFTSPRSLKIGDKNQLQFIQIGDAQEGTLTVQLYYTDSGNETLAQEEKFQLEKGQEESFYNFFVNPFPIDNVYGGRLQINGTIGDQSFGGSDKVYFNTPKTSIFVIQTDKPFYKPGQEVKFRVLKLDKNLRPSNDENDVADVYVEDPKETRLFQFKGIHLGEGIKQMQFPVADEPVQGDWRITVSNKNYTESTTFQVKEYVLPKFDVTIKFPPFVLVNAKEFTVEVCAKYTYGKPVVGTLNLNVSLEKYSYSREKVPTLQEVFELDGCYNYTVNVSLIDPNSSYRYRRIMVVANAVEKGTGVQRNATDYLNRQYSALNLNLNNEQNFRQYFKPGLPYNGKLKVTNPDGSPAPEEPIEICATVTRERVIYNWWGTKKDKFCRNYTSDENGYIKYTILPQNTDSVSIQLDARSLKYARDNSDLSQPSASMYLSPFYSPSGHFIQLANIDKPLPCGEEKDVTLLFTAKENTQFTLYYQITRQGKVIRSDTIDVAFSTEDDVSGKFQNDCELINESQTQIVPPPKPDDSSSIEEEDCPSAKESRYVPYIGEVKIPIKVDPSLSPSINLLVFYVREDRETVADSQKVEIEKCFQNQVTFEFGDKIKQPGTKTSIQVTSAPDSLCGLKIVDKSVTLLDSSDQLTKDKIFQLLESFDNGIYYSTNPCNENTPQPGLYAKGAASIIRPPGWSSSSYEDSYASFQDAGYLVISNLILLTRPCKNEGGGYPVRPIAFGAAGGQVHRKKFHSKNKGAPIALASTARRPAAPNVFAEDSIMGGAQSPTKSAVEVRDYFPETWLFQMQMTGPDGVYVSKETLPHTITEWVGSAVCVNSEDGIGLSNTTSIKGFQAFFISYTLPVSVIRGEEVVIVVSIFSYAAAALPIKASLDQPNGFVVTSDSIDGNLCIQPDTSENLEIKLKATSLGPVNITVRAETAENSDVCGDSTVSESIARDAITQPLEVEAEGFPNEKVNSILFCPTDEETQVFTDTYSLSLPDDVVPDSARAYIDVTGNILGPAIKNLNNLVALPTGCGEQNMVKFTPNYLVLDYLTDIGQLTDDVKAKAIRNLNTGYQRELTYRHNDGSFSAFGMTDKQGSMFLTAFVLRSFYEAKRYITIDNSVIVDAQKFIVSKQLPNGCFPNVGQIIDTGLQGGLEKEKNTGSITAYVLVSLLISQYENGTVIDNAFSCLSDNSASLSPYETFLFAYAEALGDKTDAAEKRLTDIKPRANSTDGVEYYNNPNGTKAINIETAAYAVLTNLAVGRSVSSVLPLVRYLSTNLNPRGGFHSTQDTCVGLDALSKFAKLVYKDPVDIMVTVTGGLDEKKEITDDNKLLVQRNAVTEVPSDLNIEATGSGCGLIQTYLRYNTITPPQKQKFYLEVVGECKSADCKERKITVTVSYVPEGKAAGMSVVQVKMVTGTVPVKESLDNLKSDQNNKILRADVEDNKVSFYFNEINNAGKRFTFDVEEVVKVDDAQPGQATAFDYYVPENSASTSYSFGNPTSAESAE